MGDIQGADRTDIHREGLVRGRLVKGPWSGQGVAFAWVLTSKSGSVIHSSVAGGGSGGGLDRGVPGSQGANLVQEEAVSTV